MRTNYAVDHAAVFRSLLGEWSLAREAPGHASMTGVATMTAINGDAAEYAESVDVRLADGQLFHGEQRYWYELTPEGIAVYFHTSVPEAAHEPRRLFHLLRFTAHEQGGLRAEATHQCKADVYQSSYWIESIERFTVRHEVRGPRKHYVLQTLYQRQRAN